MLLARRAGIALILSSILWGNVIQAFWPWAPRQTPTKPRSTSMIKTSRFFASFLLCFMAPIAEEITYRVGLFGFLKRWNVYAAYIIAPTRIRLDPLSVGRDWDRRHLCRMSLIQIPSYIFAGVGFALLYDFCGFGASTLAHITNNLISVLVSIYLLYHQ
jgi:membrane protease YdiL (CAAX protease family)